MKTLGMLPIESVRPNKWNANVLPAEEYTRLKAVMKISGPERTEPIVVRKAEDGAWEIVNGEQRWKAAKELGWKAIPALEVEGKGEAAKFLCLSFNAVRGHIDLVRLSELLIADPEMAEAVRKVYGESKVEELIESAKRLTKEAKETLSQGVKTGSTITLDKIKTVAEAPPQLQKLAASAAVDAERTVNVEYIKSVVEQFIHPEEKETIKKEEKEVEEAEEEEAEEKVEETKQYRNYEIGGRAYEVVSFVEIERPGTYAIYFDMENKKVGIKGQSDVDFNIYADKFTAPKLYRFDFKCKHGTKYIMEFDASDGTYKIEEVKREAR